MRRLWALVRGLPRGSALHQALDPKGWNWTFQDELLAAIAELIDAGNRMYFSANTKKGTRAPDPIRIRRPWEADAPRRPKRKATHQEIVSFFSGRGRRA